MRYLLDTCVISEMARKRPSAKVLTWLDAQEELTLFLSVIRVGGGGGGQCEKGEVLVLDGLSCTVLVVGLARDTQYCSYAGRGIQLFDPWSA